MAGYYFCTKDKEARKPTEEIIDWLKKEYFVMNVEKDPSYQEKDIDLLVFKTEPKEFPKRFKVEVKIDKYSTTKNYFAETISNTTIGAIGCWYKTKSDYIIYYFKDIKEVHVIPTKPAQVYVRAHESTFKRHYAETTGPNGEHWYFTEGRLVPKKELQKAVEIQIFYLGDDDDE